MSGQRYTQEFKDEAIKQVIDRGYSIAELQSVWVFLNIDSISG